MSAAIYRDVVSVRRSQSAVYCDGGCHVIKGILKISQNESKRFEITDDMRGIEWSLRALEHCVFFLRARAVIKFVLRAASTLETTTGEQRTLHKFSAYFRRRLIRVRLVP